MAILEVDKLFLEAEIWIGTGPTVLYNGITLPETQSTHQHQVCDHQRCAS